MSSKNESLFAFSQENTHQPNKKRPGNIPHFIFVWLTCFRLPFPTHAHVRTGQVISILITASDSHCRSKRQLTRENKYRTWLSSVRYTQSWDEGRVPCLFTLSLPVMPDKTRRSLGGGVDVNTAHYARRCGDRLANPIAPHFFFGREARCN